MANSKFERDFLLETIKDLQTAFQKCPDIHFVKFECKDGYSIHYIPENFKHPLRDIVNTVKSSFLLVSKLPQPTVDNNESTEDLEHSIEDLEPNLPVITKYHVYVGTPISQKLYHLFQQRDLHVQETSNVEKVLDISFLCKLDLKYARYFLSLYCQCQHIQKDLPEVWLLCDENNHQGVTFMGLVPSEFQTNSKKLENYGKIVSTVLVRSETLDPTNDDRFVLSEQKKKHMVFNRASHAETHGYAKYHIYGTLDHMAKDSERQESNITMEFAWDGVTKILQRPPPSGNAVLNICAHPEDVRDILKGISSELDSLIGHYTVVQEKLSGMDEDEENDEESDEESDKVLKFLDDLKHNNFATCDAVRTNSVEESPSSNLAAPFGIAEAIQRQDLDNTEYLWLFLKDFKSPNKILFCLKTIFSALFAGEYHPILHASNQTQIAKLMKEVLYCKTDVEKVGVQAKISKNAFNSIAALQCVVDIGLEKLCNDYTNYFIKQELVTKDKLDYYLAPGVPIAEKIQRLVKLHCILSLVALSISYAHLNYDGLRKLVSAALKFYEDHSHTKHPVFSLSLPAFSASSSKIKNICIQQFQPQTWVVAITTMNEYTTVIQVEANHLLHESFADEGKTLKSYLATTATASQICI